MIFVFPFQTQGLHRNTPFSNSYRAVGNAKVLTLRYDDWYYLLQHFPESKLDIYPDKGDDDKDLEKERKHVQIRSSPNLRQSELPESLKKDKEEDQKVVSDNDTDNEVIFLKVPKSSSIIEDSKEFIADHQSLKNNLAEPEKRDDIAESLSHVIIPQIARPFTSLETITIQSVDKNISDAETKTSILDIENSPKKSPKLPVGLILKDADTSIVVDSNLWPMDYRRESNESSIEYYVSDVNLHEEDTTSPMQSTSHAARKSTIYGLDRKFKDESLVGENVVGKNVTVPKYFTPLIINATKSDSDLDLREHEKELKKKVEEEDCEVLKKEENVDYLLSRIESKELHEKRELEESKSRSDDSKRISISRSMEKPKDVKKIENEDWEQQNQGPSSDLQARNQINKTQTKSALKKRDTEIIQLEPKRKSLSTNLINAAKKLLAKDRLSSLRDSDTLMLEQEDKLTSPLLNNRKSHSEVPFNRKRSETIDEIPKASELPELRYKTYDSQRTRKSTLAFNEDITTFEVPDDVVSIYSEKNLVSDQDAEKASMLTYADDIAMKKLGTKSDEEDEEKDKA